MATDNTNQTTTTTDNTNQTTIKFGITAIEVNKNNQNLKISFNIKDDNKLSIYRVNEVPNNNMKNYIYITDIYSNQKIILIRLNELNLSYDEFYYFYIHPDNNPENYSSMFEFKTNSLIFESKDKGFNHKDNFNNIFNNSFKPLKIISFHKLILYICIFINL